MSSSKLKDEEENELKGINNRLPEWVKSGNRRY